MNGFDLFDPGQWANATGFVVLVVVSALSLLGVFLKVAGGARWSDWLDEAHGRGSVEDRWDE